MIQQYTTRLAAEKALAWCEKHPAWMRLCDIDNIAQFYVQWHELSEKEKHLWGSESAYNDFGSKKPKVKTGFITDAGRFIDDDCRVPYGHSAMVVKVGIEAARAMQSDGCVEEGEGNLVAAV